MPATLYKTLEEAIEAAREKPGKPQYGWVIVFNDEDFQEGIGFAIIENDSFAQTCDIREYVA